MAFFMADNHPYFLTPEQQLGLPDAREKIFDKSKTWRSGY